MSEHGATRVTELEEALLLAGVLIGVFLTALAVGLLGLIWYFAAAIDGMGP